LLGEEEKMVWSSEGLYPAVSAGVEPDATMIPLLWSALERR